MDLMIFLVVPFLIIVGLAVYLSVGLLGKGRGVYVAAAAATICAWFAGLLLDANIDFGEPAGFLAFRVLLPILTMGLSILRVILRDKGD